MNERVKELAEQADAYAKTEYEKWTPTQDFSGVPNIRSIYNQKFAELIVTECLKQTELARCSFNSQPQYTDKQNALVDEGFTWGADSCKDKIKQHFGVEE